jgi:hypothetical protein
VTLLLSNDVIGGSRNIGGEWQKLARDFAVCPLTGSHLECITAHVDTLAVTIQRCLETTAAHAHPTNPKALPEAKSDSFDPDHPSPSS